MCTHACTQAYTLLKYKISNITSSRFLMINHTHTFQMKLLHQMKQSGSLSHQLFNEQHPYVQVIHKKTVPISRWNAAAVKCKTNKNHKWHPVERSPPEQKEQDADLLDFYFLVLNGWQARSMRMGNLATRHDALSCGCWRPMRPIRPMIQHGCMSTTLSHRLVIKC